MRGMIAAGWPCVTGDDVHCGGLVFLCLLGRSHLLYGLLAVFSPTGSWQTARGGEANGSPRTGGSTAGRLLAVPPEKELMNPSRQGPRLCVYP